MVLYFQNCSSDREKLLKFEAEGREFANFFEITKGHPSSVAYFD